MNSEEALKIMAKAYFELLTTLQPAFDDNENIKIGLREGLTKFLSNLYINLRGENDKYNTDYFSEEAWNHKDDGTPLVFEHIIPKTDYIQKPCEAACKNGKFADGTPFSEEAILKLLQERWQIATITEDEDCELTKRGLNRKMPKGWEKENSPFSRYKAANIPLVDSNGNKINF